MTANLVLSAARAAHDAGLSVVPVNPMTKRPMVSSWAPYQHHPAARAQLASWWSRWPGAGLAVVTGAVSGLVVVDVDSNRPEALTEALKRVGETHRIAETPRGGFHLWYAHPSTEVRNGVRLAGFTHPTDIRGDGGYVLAPPTKGYHWFRQGPLDDLPLFPLPVLGDAGAIKPKKTSAEWDELAAGAASGVRNETLAQVVGKMLSDGTRERWVRLAAIGFAQLCKPPMDPEEVRRTVESIVRRNHRNRKSEMDPRTLAQRLRSGALA